jgi:ABC-type Mn2+/Zn2+ transport system permease subunit
MLMTEIKTGGTHLGLANRVREIITGVIMIVAVALDRLRHRRGVSKETFGGKTMSRSIAIGFMFMALARAATAAQAPPPPQKK